MKNEHTGTKSISFKGQPNLIKLDLWNTVKYFPLLHVEIHVSWAYDFSQAKQFQKRLFMQNITTQYCLHSLKTTSLGRNFTLTVWNILWMVDWKKSNFKSFRIYKHKANAIFKRAAEKKRQFDKNELRFDAPPPPPTSMTPSLGLKAGVQAWFWLILYGRGSRVAGREACKVLHIG